MLGVLRRAGPVSGLRNRRVSEATPQPAVGHRAGSRSERWSRPQRHHGGRARRLLPGQLGESRDLGPPAPEARGNGCQVAHGGPDPLRGPRRGAGRPGLRVDSRPREATSQGRGAAAGLALGVGGGWREAGPPLFTIPTPRPREPSGSWVQAGWEEEQRSRDP